MNREFDRRKLLVAGAAIGAGLLLGGWTKSRKVAPDTPSSEMQPGDFVWAPERSPAGEVIMIVSIPEQIVNVYRGGIRIGRATCSTGRPGHSTPTGVFVVLQKDADHVSSTYKGAKMPFMERLTWSGIALHAGNLPGYPASHGCIRMPLEFAHLLFEVSHLGVVVIVADGHSEPSEVVHPAMFLPEVAEAEAREVVAKTAKKSLPPMRRHEAKHRPAKILVSVADRTLIIMDDGHVAAKGPLYVKNPEQAVGNHVFVLRGAHDSGNSLHWTATSFSHSGGARVTTGPEAAVIDRLTTDTETAHALHALMHPGLTMLITDRPAPEETRSSRSFVIATHHEPEGWQTRVFRE